MENRNFTNYILLLIFIAICGGLSLIYIEMNNTNAINKSKFFYEISENSLKNSLDTAIGNDLANRKPLFKINHGRWDDFDINNYLGFYEMLSDYVDARTINYRDVIDFYSEDVLIAYHNKEIQKYIADARKDGGSNEYFIKFENLAKKFENSNKPNGK